MNAKRLLASSQPCWTFTHPNRAPIIDNRRACRLTFVAEADGTVWLILARFLSPYLENNPMAGTRTCRDFPLRTVWWCCHVNRWACSWFQHCMHKVKAAHCFQILQVTANACSVGFHCYSRFVSLWMSRYAFSEHPDCSLNAPLESFHQSKSWSCPGWYKYRSMLMALCAWDKGML
jgi:hypothetical protein